MRAREAFEHRKDLLLAQLEEAASMDEAVSLCAMALEQTAMALAQDEQDDMARQRQQAVMAVARRAPRILGACRAEGELVVADMPKKTQTKRLPLSAIGAGLLAALALYEAIDGHALFALVQAVGGALLYVGARGGQADAAKLAARGALGVDAGAMVTRLSEICDAVDICVSDLMLIEQEAGAARLSGTADEAMIDLLVSLMEAKVSGRGDLALRSLDGAAQYLRMLDIEIVHYDAEHAAMFDVLPTLGQTRTIRPALLKAGRLIRRGAAACRQEGGRA